MKYHVMTLFPEMVENSFNNSIMSRALANGSIEFEAINIRDYTIEKHGKVDDYTYGGGAGMLMQAQPIYDCYKAIERKMIKKARVIYLSPKGKVFNQRMAAELAKEEELIFLCGHYEGVDQRVIDEIVTDEISIGDYVLTGGEIASVVIMDAISRLVPGVLSNSDSAVTESHEDFLLEYPQYSRPEVWNGRRVPEVLLSGHHENIKKWRREQSIITTCKNRPDLIKKANLNEKEKILAKQYLLWYYHLVRFLARS